LKIIIIIRRRRRIKEGQSGHLREMERGWLSRTETKKSARRRIKKRRKRERKTKIFPSRPQTKLLAQNYSSCLRGTTHLQMDQKRRTKTFDTKNLTLVSDLLTPFLSLKIPTLSRSLQFF